MRVGDCGAARVGMRVGDRKEAAACNALVLRSRAQRGVSKDAPDGMRCALPPSFETALTRLLRMRGVDGSASLLRMRVGDCGGGAERDARCHALVLRSRAARGVSKDAPE